MASDSDIWDDTLLIKAYDNSAKLAKSEIAKRIASATNSSDRNSKQNQPNQSAECVSYNIGDYVRATYEDEMDYEAKIIAIDRETKKCTIRYIGYDNEQDVSICDLVPSWGKKARKIQFAKAKNDKGHRKKERINVSLPNYNLPPPPPIPPMLNELNEDSENISAMLMSWYMSGYYTGLYQGQKMVKSKLKHKKPHEIV
ncbi:survival motor neuron protein isoform X2 [Condylostylus longicornis]|uniref:survival motor neuron protein isoform X2 n=1 Tax=Condylostylus longicornis TaxID=2530218 RepID=UPI00244DECFC|nr:survival motor neuron protein isoform X2 [Condylostylus longicornis]